MTSFIITANNLLKRQEYILKFCQELNIDTLDQTIIKREEIEKGEKKTTKQSIGIPQIKAMQQKVFLTPFKSKTKAVIIEEADFLTTEAQNALLKLLEEPPEHTIIILSTNNTEALLPTIQSRCKIIVLPEKEKALSNEDLTTFTNLLPELPTLSVGASLKLAEQLAKNKDEAVNWLENLMRVSRTNLLQNPTNVFLVQVIKQTQVCLLTLKTTNANPRLTLENLFLSFV